MGVYDRSNMATAPLSPSCNSLLPNPPLSPDEALTTPPISPPLMALINESDAGAKTQSIDLKLNSLASTSHTPMCLVIGKGRFGSGLAQGITSDPYGTCEVMHLSGREFAGYSIDQMTSVFTKCSSVAFCAYDLHKICDRIAAAMIQTRPDDNSIEFLDFTNPDPGGWQDQDIATALRLRNQLDGSFAVWKVTECDQFDVANVAGSTYAKVYGSAPHGRKQPNLHIPALTWKFVSADLLEETRERLNGQARIDMWYDNAVLSVCMLLFCSGWAITRYSEDFNGKYPWKMVPMYILDKAIAWVALWMMVISPFAGNILTLETLYGNFGNIHIGNKLLVVLMSVIMIWPALWFAVTYLLCWTYSLCAKKTTWTPRVMLTDMVTAKGESGLIGCAYIVTHSFLGCIICDSAYKTGWFKDPDGRLNIEDELSMQVC